MNKFSCVVALSFLAAFSLHAEGQEKGPGPTGAQTDGNFHKVIIDTDKEVNGKLEDTLKDPMELAVATDGRVFYAERDGAVKMWKPQTKKTIIIGQLKPFTG